MTGSLCRPAQLPARLRSGLLLAFGLSLLVSCPANEEEPAVYLEQREPCAERDPLRKLLFGDLHVHTELSFDAYSYGNRLSPDEAYRFARGESVLLPPLDETGVPTRSVRLDRPLDFVAVTDHGEFLGEVSICTRPELEGYDSQTCRDFRSEESNGAFDFGFLLSEESPRRFVDLCGEDGAHCRQAALPRWQQLQRVAEQHYDRSSACSFTSFPAYEYSNTREVSNLHRNVIFAHEVVPELPRSYMESPSPLQLWQGLERDCAEAGPGCDVLVLPHNSNLSNGALFVPDYPGAFSAAEQRDIAALRARMEPVVELFQHKGDSECSPRFSPSDPQCGFEKLRPVADAECGEEPGSGGMRLWGCSHRLDFVRAVLGEGLAEQQRLGVNPYPLGFIGSTDTHNGTPGMVDSFDFPGHVGSVDDSDEQRLAEGTVTHDAIINNPGGLAAVWAEENSRDAIFAALRRREVYATSGPRISLRFFAGGALPGDLCSREDGLAVADQMGSPMGATIAVDGPPRFFIQAFQDPGTSGKPGTPLAQLEVVKVWRDESGNHREQVIAVAGDPVDPVSGAPTSCAVTPAGAASLCAVWQDPDYDPQLPALYYARVLEQPSCRWSTWQCDRFTDLERPPRCDDGSVPATVQQRAWSSPIWIRSS